MIEKRLNKIRAFAKKNGWSASKIGVKAGLHKNTMRSLFKKSDWVPSERTLDKIEAMISKQKG